MDVQSMQCLLEEAKQWIKAEPTAQQVIAVKTAKGNAYHFANRCVGEARDEERFLQMLCEKDDKAVRYLVCMWRNGEIDVPSMYFRRRLIEICPQNTNALVLLQGMNAFTVREIRQLMPGE